MWQKYIRDVVDFPQKNILFKDITPLLLNAKASAACLDALSAMAPNNIDSVAAIDSRGFIFGSLLAQRFQVPFVPIRKQGKLPYNTISKTYKLEYGTATLEMHTDALKPGQNVLLHDDVLATGGTAKAACELIEQLGAKVVQCNFILEITALKGRQKFLNYNLKAAMEV